MQAVGAKSGAVPLSLVADRLNILRGRANVGRSVQNRVRLAKDRSQFHSFIKYSRNRNGSELEHRTLKQLHVTLQKPPKLETCGEPTKRGRWRNVLVTLAKVADTGTLTPYYAKLKHT
jgi:hypothetical protein